MLIAFELSMPRNNSWNGKWSGAEKRFVKVVSVGNSAKTIAKYRAICGQRFSYNFGDGWCAAVSVSEVSAIEARNLRKQSAGFCGYDWMIESIRYDGAIYGPTQPKPLAAASQS
jgi:hypothetical protein